MTRRLKFSLTVATRLFAPSLLLEVGRSNLSIDLKAEQNSSPFKALAYQKVQATPNQNNHGILKVSYRIIEACSEYCHHWFAIALRSMFLVATFAPPLVLSPLLLSESTTSAWWSILRDAITRSGPCMTKLAQWIATRPDLFPLEICLQLQNLQSMKHMKQHTRLNTCSYNRTQVEQLLRRELQRGNRYQEITLDGQEEQLVILGSGCVAQVVRGRLKLPDGSSKAVAIKLVHPHLKEAIETDMSILATLVQTGETLVPGLRAFSLSQSVREFATLLRAQLDMDLETQNLVKFRRNFNIENEKIKNGRSYSQYINFPRPFPSHCSENILIEEFVDGQLISEVIADPRTSETTRRELGDLGLTAILKMVFEDNFFHAGL